MDEKNQNQRDGNSLLEVFHEGKDEARMRALGKKEAAFTKNLRDDYAYGRLISEVSRH